MAPQLESYMVANGHKIGHPCMGFTKEFWANAERQQQLQNEMMIKLIEGSSSIPESESSFEPFVSSATPEPKQIPTIEKTNRKNRQISLPALAITIIAIILVASFIVYHNSTLRPTKPSDLPNTTKTLIIPTENAVTQWLSVDLTNEQMYKPKIFVCIDYAIMLAQHAEAKNWSMGIVLIYGKDTNQQWYNHSINSIYTLNGLVYIEPQTDEIWHLPKYQQMQQGYVYTFNSYPYEPTTVTIVEIETIYLDDLANYEFIRG